MFKFFGELVGNLIEGTMFLLGGNIGALFGMLIIYNLLPKGVKSMIKHIFIAFKTSIITVFITLKLCFSKSVKIYNKLNKECKGRVEKQEQEQLDEQLEPTKYEHLKKVKNQ